TTRCTAERNIPTIGCTVTFFCLGILWNCFGRSDGPRSCADHFTVFGVPIRTIGRRQRYGPFLPSGRYGRCRRMRGTLELQPLAFGSTLLTWAATHQVTLYVGSVFQCLGGSLPKCAR